MEAYNCTFMFGGNNFNHSLISFMHLLQTEAIRKLISHMEQDRIVADDINTMYRLVHEGNILKAVENKIGKLNFQVEFNLTGTSKNQ